MTKVIKSRLLPTGQVLVLMSFVPLLGFLLFGATDQDILANLMVWMSWWPMLCLLFLLAGRIWCALCPFSLVGRWLQRAVSVGLAPPEFLKRHGGWLIMIAFFFLSWMEETTMAMDSPRITAVVLLSILTGAVIFGLFFRGRVWCRYVCPLGGLSLVYARASFFKIRSNEAACAECATKDCVVPDADFAGCPMHLTPFAIDSVANCSFCGACVKRCKNDSLHVAFEAPSRDLSAQPTPAPVAVGMIVLLAGFVSFLNTMHSGRLPDTVQLQYAANPVFCTTVLMAGMMIAGWTLFEVLVRLAAGSESTIPRPQLLQLGALPMIPLLLFSHLGHLSERLWRDGGHLLAKMAEMTGLPWLHSDAWWGMAWAGYFSPVCILIGLALSLGVLRWALTRQSALPVRRIALSVGLSYIVFAGWNLFFTWPFSTTPASAISIHAIVPSARAGAPDGWQILWPFVGINAALLALALIARCSEFQSGADKEHAEFSANRTWVIRDKDSRQPTEILEWLLEQAILARWRIPAVVGLANAGTEIISFLQRTLPDRAAITLNATLRKRKGVMTISHEGRPLTLPDYKAVTSLDDIDDAAMDGLELRLAVAQVEHMSYQARIDESRCRFTLRQTC